MRLIWVVVLCLATVALAAPRKVTVKKRNGDVVKGTVVSEMETGYLIKPEGRGKAVVVKFEDVADLAEGDAPLSSPAAAPAPSPARQTPVASPQGLPPPPPPPPLPSSLPPPQPSVAAAQPCAANEVYVQYGQHDDVAGAVCAMRTEVTVADYQACVNARACSVEGMLCGAASNWNLAGRATHPVNCVSARQADAYCAWRQSRLPTLLEFQALARRHDGEGEYPWGNAEVAGRVCWMGEQGRRGTCAVGSYPEGAGRSGVLDIVGNVWEWTATSRRNDRVFAGGAWNDQDRSSFETTSEKRNSPDSHLDDVGFRCIRAVR